MGLENAGQADGGPVGRIGMRAMATEPSQNLASYGVRAAMLNTDQQRHAARIIEAIGDELWPSDLTPEQAQEVIEHIRWQLKVPATVAEILPAQADPPLNEQTHPALTVRERNLSGVIYR